MMNIAVAGASGRMGRMLVEAIAAAPDVTLSGALDRAGSDAIGQDAAAFAGQPAGVLISADLADGLAGADVLIDFTRPEGTLEHLAHALHRGGQVDLGLQLELDQVGDDLGVGLGDEHVAVGL